MSNLCYTMNQTNYNKIPGSLIAYWIRPVYIDIFKNKKVYNYGDTKKGILTGNDELFVRLWFEVNITKMCLKGKDFSDTKLYKWFPITSGGERRKWYGNLENIVNLYNYGAEIKSKQKNYRLRDSAYYFKECITWSEIGGDKLAVRYVKSNILFGNGGPVCFAGLNNYLLLGMLNSKVSSNFLAMLAPTVNFGPDQIKAVPIIYTDVDSVVKENVNLSKADWDSFETSWDFKKHPLI